MQAIKTKKIKCKEYCLVSMSEHLPNTILDALEQFKEELPETSIVDIKIDRPLITFFYIENTDSQVEANNNGGM